jgi:molybdate transport system regulatory protein
MASLTIRIDLSRTRGIGPGKIRLLEMIDKTGSISAAGREMKMSYRRAWLLLDELNHAFREPVATAAQGGRSGGGTQLTPFGRRLVHGYRKMELDAEEAVSAYLGMVRLAVMPAHGAPPAKRARSK